MAVSHASARPGAARISAARRTAAMQVLRRLEGAGHANPVCGVNRWLGTADRPPGPRLATWQRPIPAPRCVDVRTIVIPGRASCASVARSSRDPEEPPALRAGEDRLRSLVRASGDPSTDAVGDRARHAPRQRLFDESREGGAPAPQSEQSLADGLAPSSETAGLHLRLEKLPEVQLVRSCEAPPTPTRRVTSWKRGLSQSDRVIHRPGRPPVKRRSTKAD